MGRRYAEKEDAGTRRKRRIINRRRAHDAAPGERESQ
jgi:hypothetical protein